MQSSSETGLAQALAEVVYLESISTLATQFHTQTVTLRLERTGFLQPLVLTGHTRRAYLGALGKAASPQARLNQPCPWEPPCTFDVFCREQLRGPRGDGLPKPYLLFAAPDGLDMLLHLRVFGMATDWLPSAADGLITGLRTILPWRRLDPSLTDCPEITDRTFTLERIVPSNVGDTLRLTLQDVDISGTAQADAPQKLVGRLMRRVDGVARWSGVALHPDTTRQLREDLSRLEYRIVRQSTRAHFSPNSKGQARRKQVLSGEIEVSGDIEALHTLCRLGELTHLGRGVVEGLGRLNVCLI